MKQIKTSKKRTKFNLDDMDSVEEQAFMGFTHGGKILLDLDDFKDEIPLSSDDEQDRYNPRKGDLNEELVSKMNFGGG